MTNPSLMWSAAEPLLLASRSKIRHDLLMSVGLPAKVTPSSFDERSLDSVSEFRTQTAPIKAIKLAAEKALSVSRSNTESWVIGADQILECDGHIFHKAATREEAEQTLTTLSGRTHHLHSALAVVHHEECLWSHCETADLEMRALSKDDLKHYLDLVGTDILTSVGNYHWEGLGRHLFERVRGQDDVIMGLPLLPLLSFFRSAGCLKF